MEFIESISRSNGSSRMARLTVTLISERSNWVSVSKPLANQLFDLNFLPVVLQIRVLDGAGMPSKQPQHTHHVAWAGAVIQGPGVGSGGSGGAGGGGTLGVPSALASALGLRAGAQVHTAPLLGVPIATSVEVEPAGESDWEVVEANAGFLEEQLLGQVGVLERGQRFNVWARGGAAVRLHVLATQPADLVRLVPGCEVHVAPKPRGLLPFGGQIHRSQEPAAQSRGQGKRPQPAAAPQAATAATVVPLTGPANGSRISSTSSCKSSVSGCNGVARASALAYYTPSCSAAPQQRDGTAPAAAAVITSGAAPAAGGVGLQAPPAWASGLVQAMSGRFTPEQVPEQSASGSVAATAEGFGDLSHDSRVPVGLRKAAWNAVAPKAVEAPGQATAVVQPPPPPLPHAVPCGDRMRPGGSVGGRSGATEELRTHASAGALPPSVAQDPGVSPFASSDSTASGVTPELMSSRGPAVAKAAHAASAPPLSSTNAAGAATPRGMEAAAPAAAAAAAAAFRSQSQPPPVTQPLQSELSAKQQQPRAHLHATNSRRHLSAHRHAPNPLPLRLRVLELPPSKYLVSIPPLLPEEANLAPEVREQQATPTPYVDARLGRGDDAVAAAAAVATAPPALAVSSWLTLAVAVAPVTAAVLVGGAAAGPAEAAGGVIVRLHGRGTVRDLLGVLVPEPACPPGHVMLAPPLQHVLCVLPHMHVTVTALPAVVTAAAAEAAALPSLTLHPLPVPDVRKTDSLRKKGNGGGGGGADGSKSFASLHGNQPGGGSTSLAAAAVPPPDGILHQQAVFLAAGVRWTTAAAAASDGDPALPAVPPPATSHAVNRWLAAQAGGIRRAVLGYGGVDATTDGSGTPICGDCSGGLELLLPIASGTVVHFRIHGWNGGSWSCNRNLGGSHGVVGDTGAGGSGGGGGGGGGLQPAAPGDYCLIVHAVRRTHTSATAGPHQVTQSQPTPPFISERTISASLATPTHGSLQGPQTQQPFLAAKLGQLIVLPDVSYNSARHAATLALRAFPPPLQLMAPAPAAPQPVGWAAVHTPPVHEVARAAVHGTAAAMVEDQSPASMSATNVTEQILSSKLLRSKAAPPVLDLDLDHISWLRDQLEQCLRRVVPQLDPWVGAAMARAGLPRCGGVLVTGAPGSGRSQLLKALGDIGERHPAYQAHVLHVRCGQLAGSSHSTTTSALAALAAEALHCAPCLLLLDDLDVICPSAAEGPEYGMQHPDGAAAAARLADWLSALLDELAAATATAAAAAATGHSDADTTAAAATAAEVAAAPPPAVAVVASARDAASLHAALRRVGRLDFEVRLPTPGSVGRAAMLSAAARQRGLAVDAGQLAAVAGAAEGFEGVDLRLLLDRAVHAALRRQLRGPEPRLAAGGLMATTRPPSEISPAAPSGQGQGLGLSAGSGLGRDVALAVTQEDLKEALEGFVPAAFWGVQQASAAAGKAEGWEDVGGLEDVVASLREALLLPVRYRDLVAAAPLRLRTGALLYGPPGCGKTHVVAAAVAAVSKIAPVRFLTVKGPELLNKYIGASEAAVRDLFARAAAAAPAVLFFDEFDAIAPPRGHDSTGVTDRVVNQLLTELDGVEGLRGVVVLAATSRPDLIDAALLRPGRLDRLLFCGPPKGPEQRLAILRALSRRLNLARDVDLRRVAEASEGMTGADLGAVLSEAQLHAINESVEEATTREAGCPDAITHASAVADASGASGAAVGPAASASQMAAGGVADGRSASGEAASGSCSTSTAGGGGGGGGGSESSSGVAGGGDSMAVSPGPQICMRHVLRALSAARPSLPSAEAARLAALYDRFRRDREAPVSRPGPGGADPAIKRATLA
ncbi:hypothetical protein Vretimale_12481 [Volvox reticuliferus]|uniref:Peroxisomal ATPase PEX1 n=1 Tax=Volvox reticuliferus TaxID=1737510 RepID=A0A8J4CCL8_9CHLO|nr:hypothetical protein Vretifemale_9048 [Volvox reticuliferus]GIM08489.1 hypothetical protein Vretimale_12481 [Volvox reticuliferus]